MMMTSCRNIDLGTSVLDLISCGCGRRQFLLGNFPKSVCTARSYGGGGGNLVFLRRDLGRSCRAVPTKPKEISLVNGIGEAKTVSFDLRQETSKQPISLSSLFEVVADDLQTLNDNLLSIVGAENPVLISAAEQIFGAGGKRMRPGLVFLVSRATAELAGLKELTTEHRRLGEIIEMIHTASLIHDDVLDESDMRINGRFGTLTQVPIHHLDRSLDFYALCALYAVTDVALVTSLRDGMNLVSYEFVACQEAKKGVLILSEFAGAAQSLGAGAILVNPWNITEVAASIGQALNMSPEEREKRHRHNFHHVKTHTAQEWAETFVSELNDTVIEAQLRISKVPPELPQDDAIRRYSKSNNRLLILGFNATLTEPVDNQGRRGDQIKEMDLNLHPELKGPLKALCSDPSTTIVVLSGSSRSVLDKNFGEYDMWLAAENGMFLRLTNGEWMTTMPEHLNMEWVDSVKHVFKYFTERTPRSHFETRDTSLIWNYKYADVEFGRLQARDLLQHLWTGPISNASVDVVQGSRSVEVRAVGVTKGAAIDRILGEIVHSKSMTTPIDYVLCIGHFLGKDEDVYTFFEPELPSDIIPAIARSRPSSDSGTTRSSSGGGGDRRPPSKSTHNNNNNNKSSSKSSSSHSNNHHNNKASSQRSLQTTTAERKSGGSSSNNHSLGNSRRPSPEKISWNVLDLKGENYFSCAVGRTRTSARYLLGSPDDVVCFLEKLADTSLP